MPYRLDVPAPTADTFDRLVDLGALDAEMDGDVVAAIMPDDVDAARVREAIGRLDVRVSPARGRDGNSVWVLRPRPMQAGRIRIVPAGWPDRVDGLRLIDDAAFGTGLHPTTAMCLGLIDEVLAASRPSAVLDVGTGSGVLALAALHLGVPAATAIDVDSDALSAAAANAVLNGLASRLRVAHGGPESIDGVWPLVVANILAAPLIEMASSLAQRVERAGVLVLSGVGASLADDVRGAYRHVGMRQIDQRTRDGWAALLLRASW